jgi:hypothetical protein
MSIIFLRPNGPPNSIGDDTFWCWAAREFPGATLEQPARYPDDSIVLVYSMCGDRIAPGGTKVACCWELYPEMAFFMGDKGAIGAVETTHKCVEVCRYMSTHNRFSREYYQGKFPDRTGMEKLLPLAIDTDFWAPLDKAFCRRRHGIPVDATVGFWSGTTHPMKGFDQVVEYAKANPEIYWIIAWKRPIDAGDASMLKCRQYRGVNQQVLRELMNCADFGTLAGRLRPFVIVEWEQMACDLPMLDLTGLEREFVVSDHPREQVFQHRWDRHQAKEDWIEFIESIKD